MAIFLSLSPTIWWSSAVGPPKWYYGEMERPSFVNKEFYHIYNRGVDKRNIFLDRKDVERFLRSMKEFNSFEPIGSLHEQSVERRLSPVSSVGGRTAKIAKMGAGEKKLVNIVAYCLNPNHFHFILQQVSDGGVSEFMKRLSGGYAWYFNNKQKRSGALFQGRFKAVHIDSNAYLLYVSAYVNLNNRGHSLKNPVKSSWDEYVGETSTNLCSKSIILGQFDSAREYKEFAEDTLVQIIANKELRAELESFLID